MARINIMMLKKITSIVIEKVRRQFKVREQKVHNAFIIGAGVAGIVYRDIGTLKKVEKKVYQLH